MARSVRTIPQKTLSAEDRATFDQMIERIRPLVGVHFNKQPTPFILDTRILTDVARFPVNRPTQTRAAWGGYFTYSPTYSALSPEQRWSYIAWLAGDENLNQQLFRIMRLYALCAEFGSPRRAEAIVALRDLYERSANDTVAQSSIGNVLTLAYAATEPTSAAEWLHTFAPTTAIPTDVLVRCWAAANIEANGNTLLDIAGRCNFKLGRGMGGRRAAIETAIHEIALRWGERSGTTVIRTVVEQTPTIPTVMSYGDTLVLWASRMFSLATGTFLFDRSDAGVFMRGLAAAAQEYARSQKKGSPPLDGLELLDSILHGDGGMVQFDLSGSADYTMMVEEEAALEKKLGRIKKVVGIKIVKQEWDVYSYWSGRNNYAPEAVIVRSLPIKTPTSPEPWNAPTPPTYAAAAYKSLTPEQRWWYLDWLAGEPVSPLEVFLAVRYKGLEAAFNRMAPDQLREQISAWVETREPTLRAHNVFGMIETLFERTTDEHLQRAALEQLLPTYAELQDTERASAAVNRTPLNTEQIGRMVAYLWEAGGTLDGRSLLYVARGGGFNHTPLTRECFAPIAERAEQLLAEWEADHGPLDELPVVSLSFGRSKKRVLSAVAVAAEIARQAQEEIKAQRRSAPRTTRMSADELEAERVELAELPTNVGNGPDEAIYQQLATDAALHPTYLAHGTDALERGEAAIAVAFLRRAAELDAQSAAHLILPLARLRLNEAQKAETPNDQAL